ncbi:MAG: hypothetical protein IJN77_06355 [Oscillospiraceae bacterium]|nr:hypothetical protein [Oscillospiraceae bacterium]
MKNKSLLYVVLLNLLLIAYGLFSLSIALDVLFPVQENHTPTKEIILDSGNKIEIYNM